MTAGPAWDVWLSDRTGQELHCRPLREEDRATVATIFPTLSERTRLDRFHTLFSRLSEQHLDSLFDLDYRTRFAWGVEIQECDPKPAALGRYVAYENRTGAADLAITVADAWQGRGIGSVLLDLNVITAAYAGLDRFETVVLATNNAMLAALRRRGAEIGAVEDAAVNVVLPLAPLLPGLADHPLTLLLHAPHLAGQPPAE
jgi:GNAT superfamily N-acetyltransferase